MSVASSQPVDVARRRRSTRGAIRAAIVGTGLEWYDYIVYGFFAANVAVAFFPSEDPFISAMLAAATFAVSFLVRPIAGVVLGRYSDRIGRKPALMIVMALMGVSILIIAVTPDYSVIGIAAPILVIVGRLLQGVSIGGEFATATSLLREFAPPGRKELYSSIQAASQAFAQVLAGVMGVVVGLLFTADEAQSWGWRIPFLLGVLIVPVGFYMRARLDESPEYVRHVQAAEHAPSVSLATVFRTHRLALLAGFGGTIAGTAAAYVWVIYLPSYVVRELGLPGITVFATSAISGVVFLGASLLGGWWADQFGNVRVGVSGIVAFLVIVLPALLWVVDDPSFARLLVAQSACLVPVGILAGASSGLITGIFPVEVRSTGAAISYNAATLCFGGVAPLILTWLIQVTGSNLMPAFYGIVTCSISLILLWLARSALKPASTSKDAS